MCFFSLIIGLNNSNICIKLFRCNYYLLKIFIKSFCLIVFVLQFKSNLLFKCYSLKIIKSCLYNIMVSIKKKKYINRSKYKLKNTNKYNFLIGGEDTDISQKICKGRTKENCNDGTGNCKYIEGKKRKYCKRVSRCKKSCDYPCSKILYKNKMYCIPPDKENKPQQIDDVKDILIELIVDDTREKDKQIENIEENNDLENEDLENEDVENEYLENEDVENEYLENQDTVNHDLENRYLENQAISKHDLENEYLENQDTANHDLENEYLENQDTSNHDLENRYLENHNKVNKDSIQSFKEQSQLNDNMIINKKKMLDNKKKNVNIDTVMLDTPSIDEGSIASILYGKSSYDNNVGSCSIL